MSGGVIQPNDKRLVRLGRLPSGSRFFPRGLAGLGGDAVRADAFGGDFKVTV